MNPENDAMGPTVALVKCTHVFHTECISTWQAINPVCPVCRTAITQEEQQAAITQQQRSERLDGDARPSRILIVLEGAPEQQAEDNVNARPSSYARCLWALAGLGCAVFTAIVVGAAMAGRYAH